MEREKEVNENLVQLKELYADKPHKENQFFVCVIGFDPMTESRNKVWSLTGEDSQELWDKAVRYAERYHY